MGFPGGHGVIESVKLLDLGSIRLTLSSGLPQAPSALPLLVEEGWFPGDVTFEFTDVFATVRSVLRALNIKERDPLGVPLLDFGSFEPLFVLASPRTYRKVNQFLGVCSGYSTNPLEIPQLGLNVKCIGTPTPRQKRAKLQERDPLGVPLPMTFRFGVVRCPQGARLRLPRRWAAPVLRRGMLR